MFRVSCTLGILISMNLFKRATTSVLRRLRKTLTLVLIVFILGTAIAGAVVVERAIRNTEMNLRRSMQPIVSIDENMTAFMDSPAWDDFDWNNPPSVWPELEPLTPEHVRAIGSLPYISFYDYTLFNDTLRGDELLRYPLCPDDDPMCTQFSSFLPVRGTSQTQMLQIQQGIFNLIQGREFESAELEPGGSSSVVLVSKDFAEINNLLIDSTFELYHLIHIPTEDPMIPLSEREVYAQVGMEFRIVGIIDLPEEPAETLVVDEIDEPIVAARRINFNNTIYVPNWALEDLQNRQLDAYEAAWNAVDFEAAETAHSMQLQIRPLFIIEDPTYIDEFIEVATPLLPTEFHVFQDFTGTFARISTSMETMQEVANWILYGSIGAAILILSLLITLFLRDRRHEIGIYLALGEKRKKIIFQILLEVIVTAITGLTLAVLAGNIISTMTSQHMLRTELLSQQDRAFHPESNIFEYNGATDLGIPFIPMTNDEMLLAFEISFNIPTIVLFYVIGLTTITASSLISVIYVVVLNPKKVLL